MERRLVLFARAPERGRVKTRLAASVGEERALSLYEAFLSDCGAAAAEAARRAGASLTIAVAGPIDHPRLVALAAETGAQLAPQPDGDLGVRMGAFIDPDAAVCLIGSDSPTLSAAQIARAFVALVEHEVVIGPGVDGGYWLLGARRDIPELLTEIAWSTDRVLPTTLERLRGRSTALLDFFYDVDDESDLQLLERHLGVLPGDVAPATRQVLSR